MNNPDHKMLPLRILGRLLGLAVMLVILLAATTVHREDVFVGDEIHFVDADCYSRMTRAAEVWHHPLRSIRHHDFENAPAGVATHTTAPMDWTIALLATVMRPFTPQPLDLAGAWISPLLGALTLVALWVWSLRERLPYRHAMLLLLAASPIVAQAFRLGRPDHQSLLLLLLSVALAAEWNLWRGAGRRTAIAWGIAWGAALWTSLYEPLVIFGFLAVARPALLGTRSIRRPWPAGWLALGATAALALAFDGWRVSAPAPEVAEFFPRWAHTIGELGSLPPWSSQFPGWLGWLPCAIPLLLAWRAARLRDPHLWAMLALTLAAFVLTCWQIRWGCYLALLVAMALPFGLPAIPNRAAVWIAFVLGLLPVARQWDARLDADPLARAENRADATQLHAISRALRAAAPGTVLAPWWLCPPIAYWSGQRCVAGSSHESLPGTVATARFYLSDDPSAAREQARRLGVRYVVAYEPSRVISTSTTLLGDAAPARPLITTLYDTPAEAPDWLHLLGATPYFRLYETRP